VSSRRAKSLIAKSAELAFAAPQVVAHRVTRMALAGTPMSARDRREFKLMSAEKRVAFGKSWNAMMFETVRANQQLAMFFFRAAWSVPLRRAPSASAVASRFQEAATRVLGKGLAPVHRTAVANAKRLARTKLR